MEVSQIQLLCDYKENIRFIVVLLLLNILTYRAYKTAVDIHVWIYIAFIKGNLQVN